MGFAAPEARTNLEDATHCHMESSGELDIAAISDTGNMAFELSTVGTKSITYRKICSGELICVM